MSLGSAGGELLIVGHDPALEQNKYIWQGGHAKKTLASAMRHNLPYALIGRFLPRLQGRRGNMAASFFVCNINVLVVAYAMRAGVDGLRIGAPVESGCAVRDNPT
jgi:hypothetical protein